MGYALAGVGVLVTGGEMVRLHPHQHVYFNELVDRTTSEYLRNSYVQDPWRTSCREGLVFLRRRHPDMRVYVRGSWPLFPGWLTFPKTDRAWLVLVGGDEAADFQVLCGKDLQRKDLSLENATYVRKVYNNTLLTVTGLVTVPERARSVTHRVENTYSGATAGRLVANAKFDVYMYPGSRLLGYTRETCTVADVKPWFFVHVFPVDEQQLPSWRSQYGFDNLDFSFVEQGKQGGGKCWATVELPAYEIARVHTGQYTEQGRLWETELVGPLP